MSQNKPNAAFIQPLLVAALNSLIYCPDLNLDDLEDETRAAIREALRAVATATQSGDTRESLTEEYKEFCNDVELKHISADELLFELLDTDQELHKIYVSEFVARWESIEMAESA